MLFLILNKIGVIMNIILPEQENFDNVEDLNNSILELNDLSHWLCLSKDSYERIDGAYFDTKFSDKYFKGLGNHFVTLLKEYDKTNPIKDYFEESYA